MKWRPKYLRNLLTLTHDTLAAGLSFMVALYLRWSDAMWVHAADYVWPGMLLCAAITLGMVLLTRLYRRLWRYVSLKDLFTIGKITIAALGCFYGLLFLTMRLELLPRSVPLLHAMVLVTLLAAPRVLIRAFHEKRLALPHERQIPVLLIGATADAELFIRESLRSPSFSYRVVGVVATTPEHAGRNINHVRVYGTTEELSTVLRKLRRKDEAPQRMVLTDPLLEGGQVRTLLEIAEREGVPLARMPRLANLAQGDGDKFDIKPVAVEDILGRPQARLDWEAMRAMVMDKTVLITGAGGSIGSELVRQVTGFHPRALILVDNGEYNLYEIDREVHEHAADLPRKAVLGDVREGPSMRRLFSRHRPDIVFHAAALKHVPLCETNPEEAVLSNALGTRIIADACVEAEVPLMVQVSTDKAVNPTNIMGACKRIGETYCQALGQSGAATRFITVRFGNVLGSTGSVVPLFQRQLEGGGPLTVTHKDMTRYFMTIREAVQLIIQAAVLGLEQRQQAAPIYVLEMGEPVRIEDLALQMIRLAGLRPYEDIAISYTGLRPGEKLHEELFYDSEPLIETDHTAIKLAQAREIALAPLREQLDALQKSAREGNRRQLMQQLQTLVPEYRPESVT